MDPLLDKNNKLSKELSTTDDISLKTRIFSFFYYVLKKKDINILLCTLFLILEMIQLISFAFSTPVSNIIKNSILICGKSTLIQCITYI